MGLSHLPISIVPIKAKQHAQGFIHMSKALAEHWKIQDNVISVLVGNKELLTEIAISDIPKTELYFTEQTLEELHLPIQKRQFIFTFSTKEQSMTIGPIIALLTEISDNQDDGPNFRSVHTFCEELEHGISKIGGLFFVFSINDFSIEGINGYYYSEEQWVKGILPLPDVIYNRIHSRMLENHKGFQHIKNEILLNGIKFFNHSFLSKWEVHRFLQEEKHLQVYLPETQLFSQKSLEDLIQKNQLLFLKPINGSQGRGILRLQIANDHIKLLSSSHEKETILKDKNHLYELINKKVKQRPFILQQGLSLKTIENKPLDFRVLCHKNYQDIWSVTSMVARLSGENQFVSNIARGGEIMKPMQALIQCFDRDTALHLFSLMKEVSIEVSNIIEQKCEGLIGELGIDIGVDYDARIWVIEVNSKPSKNFEEYEKKLRPSARAIIEYCTKLSINSLTIRED